MYIASDGINTAVILRDTDPQNPRDPGWQENLGKMVCWHSRYNLGDKHSYSEPHDFAKDMVAEHVPMKDVLRAIVNGELPDFRVSAEKPMDGSYAIEGQISVIPGKEKWEVMDWAISKDMEVIEGEAPFDLADDVLDYCYPDTLLRLCEKYGDVAIQPLYLYDHSGISISTGSFVGRAPHAEWDSGQVGYIYMEKDKALQELAMPADTLRIARILPLREQTSVKFPRQPSEDIGDALARNGFSSVAPEHIKNLYDEKFCGGAPAIDEYALKQGKIFKKDRTLYAFIGGYPTDDSFSMNPLATFNPDLRRLQPEEWKSRAAEVLEAEVVEYNNYLTGEVYGYQLYEGTEEVDSCWGFNPGSGTVEDLFGEVLGGWHPELISKFEFSYDETFDIDSYLEENEFPELDAAIRAEVENVLQASAEQGSWPFAVSREDIRNNVNEILDDIVEGLCQEHKMPAPSDILKEISQHAGISREAKPKLSVSDLEPDKDYTADELMGLLKGKKSPLDDMIKAAQAKAGQGPSGRGSREEPQR